MESDKAKNKRPPNPRACANPISALTFSWILPIFIKGYKKPLREEDLFDNLNEHRSNVLGDELERLWEEEQRDAAKKKKIPSLFKVLCRAYGWILAAHGITVFMAEVVFRMLQPLLLGRLIDYFTQKSKNLPSDASLEDAYLCAGGLVACSALIIVFLHPYMFATMLIGMKMRVGVCSLIYRKSLRLSKSALGKTTVGKVVNLLSNDVNRFDFTVTFIHDTWLGLVQITVVTYFLWDLIGASSLIGVVALLIFVPLQGWLGKKISSLRLKTANRTDERVRLMNEIINGIQVIKMYTWERPFAFLVSNARMKEIKEIRKLSYIRGVMMSFIIFHTRIAIFVTILAYVLLGNIITAEKVFVLTSFYNTLQTTLTIFLPLSISLISECSISIKRIQEFLLQDERALMIEPGEKENGKELGSKLELNGITKPVTSETKDTERGLRLIDVSAQWTEDQADETLSNISFNVTPGKLTAIIGPVGCGKTSLFHAILKELSLKKGRIETSGSISYASQEPWLFAGSVRQNILFGQPYEKERYKQVVKVCALQPDLEMFAYGDKTLVGERGVALSGGQRARINLARAVYRNADIILLDDPLSAVDTHVGKHLFEDCIKGYLSDKTVLLITHQLQYLSNANQLVLMENGSVSKLGTYTELMQAGLDFTKLLDVPEEKKEEDVLDLGKRRYSRQSSSNSVSSSQFDGLNEGEGGGPEQVSENRSEGSVSSTVYKKYLAAGGSCCFLLTLFCLLVITQAAASSGDYWITYWVNLEEHVFSPNVTDTTTANPLNLERFDCLWIFSGIICLTVIVTLIRSTVFFHMCMSASFNLHNSMFESISRATMWFFNNNPSGRILNRFSKDIGSIDELLPSAFIDCVQIGLATLAIMTVVPTMNVWLLIPTVAITIVFYFLRRIYLATSRSVKRLEGITRSPVFTHLSASLQGLTTIRAFSAEKILESEFDVHQDLHSSAWYIFLATNRVFAYWLDMVCLIYILLVTMSFLVLDMGTTGGNVGLAITQAIGLTGMLQWGMRQSAELENQMTSVERVLEYSNLKSEPPLESTPEKKPPSGWPKEGRVEFREVYLKYSENDEWVLKDLNFTIAPQEKIGIVGRTGAGKSSLIAALFRLTDVSGSIVIDNIDVSGIGLHDLRSKISIIPQEPVLFSGTLRKNLDPFDQNSDDVLWKALEEVELMDVVRELSGGLQAVISEGGTNLSVGQRQLLCLARAIVRNNKILILDEATANVDPQTDVLIQRTIRTKFELCTVLTIAHRLNTVMDSDKVLVMDAGSMVEFDHPHILLQRAEGYLRSLVLQTGPTTSELLFKVAADNYNRRSVVNVKL